MFCFSELVFLSSRASDVITRNNCIPPLEEKSRYNEGQDDIVINVNAYTPISSQFNIPNASSSFVKTDSLNLNRRPEQHKYRITRNTTTARSCSINKISDRTVRQHTHVEQDDVELYFALHH